jgi:hypothetical protein
MTTLGAMPRLPGWPYGHWEPVRDGNPLAAAIYRRHYSAYVYADGRRDDPRYRNRNLICGPGEKMLLLAGGPALFVWRRFIDDSGQTGVNCAVFRNEGPVRSSDLIREADALAWSRWPAQRLYTYVNPTTIRSRNPGCCFLKAGWRRCGRTKGGLVVLEHLPEAVE